MRSSMLRVPGAHLYYEIRGSGPVLMLIPAGAGDAGSFGNVADHLASHYTVVTYDRRGYSRSLRDDPTGPVEVQTHSADSAHLLAAVTTTPAYVFGSSGGGIVGLDLAVRFPETVRTLVAHEPPTRQLLPDGDRLHDDLYEVYRRDGAVAAIRQFAAGIGVEPDRRDREPGVQVPKGSRWSASNLEFFLAADVAAVGRYQLGPEALRAIPVPVVPAAGIASRTHWPYRCAATLAEHLGTELVEFPGDHAGFVTHPRAFAVQLHRIFSASQRQETTS